MRVRGERGGCEGEGKGEDEVEGEERKETQGWKRLVGLRWAERGLWV